MKRIVVVLSLLCAWFMGSPALASAGTLKVFLLAGQSNMEGQAYTYDSDATASWNIPTMEFLLSGTPAASNYLANMPFGFKHSLSTDWLAPRDDVWAVHYYSGDGSVKNVLPSNDPADIVSGIQPLMPGFGVGTGFGSMIGPELGMGIRLGDALEAPVFLFKSDRGGTTLGNDWRPPTAVAARGGSIGPEYANTMVRFIEFLDALDADLADDGVLNDYGNATSYEISAVFWFQGWNEQYDDSPYTAAQLQAEYTDNLKDLIHSIRAADARIPGDLPLIIGESSDQNAVLNASRQAAVAQLNDEIPNTAAFFDTANMKGVDWGNNNSGVPFSQGWGYHFHARAENFLEIGWKAAGVVLDNGYTLPLRLTDAAASTATPTSATVNVTINTNADEVVLYWDTTDRGPSEGGWIGRRGLGAWPGGLGQVSGTLTGLVADTVYTFRCWATNTPLAASAWSLAATVSTDFAATQSPSNVTASAVNAGRIDLSWNDHFNTETGYLVRCASDAAFTVDVREHLVAPDVTAFSDVFAAPGSTYYYQVAALNTYGQGSFSAPASAATPAGPTAGLVGYWPMDNTRGTNLTDYTSTANDGAFVQGTPAWVPGKFGNAMDLVKERTDRAQIPHHASYNANNTYSISFWLYPVSSWRSGYQFTKGVNKVGLHYSSNNDATWGYFGSPWTGTYLGFNYGAQVWKHIVAIYDPSVTYAKQVYVDGTLMASNTTAGVGSDTALNTDSIVFNAVADANKSSLRFDDVAIWNRALTTNEIAYLYNGGTGNIVSDLNQAPSAPTNVTATASDTRAILAWNLNTVDPDPASYSVYRHTSTGGPYTRVASNLTAGSHVDTNLVNGTPYYYVIRTVDLRGAESADSAEVTATPFADSTPPGAPTGLSAQAGYTRVYLSWTANTEPDMAGYNVYRAPAAAGPFSNVAAMVTGTNCVDQGRANGVAVYYRVTAEDVAGNESAVSATVSVTPQTYHDTNPGLAGYWPLDQSTGTQLLDITANTNHGAFTAGSPQWVSGKFGNGLYLDGAGSGDKAGISGLAAYRANKVFTVAFWMNQVQGYRKTSIGFNGIGISDFYLNSFGTPWSSTDTGFRNDEVWHHLVFVFDPYDPGGYGKRFYVDGTLVASNIAYATDSSVLGGSGMSFNVNTWVGTIDEVACWDRALTVDQIESLWNEGDGRPAYTPPPAGTVFVVR